MRDGKLIFRTANRGALNLSIKLAAGSACTTRHGVGWASFFSDVIILYAYVCLRLLLLLLLLPCCSVSWSCCILMLAVANAQLSCNCEHERNLRDTQVTTADCACISVYVCMCGFRTLSYTFWVAQLPHTLAHTHTPGRATAVASYSETIRIFNFSPATLRFLSQAQAISF